jgi:hypothetical protein
MQPDIRVVLDAALEDGVRAGLRRFYKHREDDAPDGLEDALGEALNDAMHHWFVIPAQSEPGE